MDTAVSGLIADLWFPIVAIGLGWVWHHTELPRGVVLGIGGVLLLDLFGQHFGGEVDAGYEVSAEGREAVV